MNQITLARQTLTFEETTNSVRPADQESEILTFPMRIPRVSVIDHDARRRAVVSHFLSGNGVHAMPFDSVAELLRYQRDDIPVLMIDADMEMDALVRGMRTSGHWMPVIAYAEEIRVSRVVRAIRRGAVGYLAWPFALEELAEALDGALDDHARPASIDRAQIVAANRIARLSLRERQVLLGIMQGHTSRTIGEMLGISHRTVEKHRENLQIKLEVQSTSDAIRIATDARLEELQL